MTEIGAIFLPDFFVRQKTTFYGSHQNIQKVLGVSFMENANWFFTG